MNPTAALLLARATEDDYRRQLRQRQLAKAARRQDRTESRSWLDRIRSGRPRLADSASGA